MRAALYWAPEATDPLHALGSAWLGRDAETAALVRQPGLPGIAELTAAPCGYGLHATLKPPFRFTQPYVALRAAVAGFAGRTRPFALPSLAVMDLKGFLALRETAPCPPRHALADAAVESLDAFRAPADEAELARRRRPGLSPTQAAMLGRWGYPFVMAEWQFHVTLTRRLAPAEHAAVLPALLAHFGTVPGIPRLVTELCLFTQMAPGAPFLIAERFPLRGT